MWPGSAGCVIGGIGDNNDHHPSILPSIPLPTTTVAYGVWNPYDAQFRIQQNRHGLQWPSLPDPNFAKVITVQHFDKHGTSHQYDDVLSATAQIRTISLSGGANINNALFGQYSIQAGDSTDFGGIGMILTIGVQDFTIEFWQQGGSASTVGLCDMRQAAGDARPYIRFNVGKLSYFTNGAEQIVAAATMPAGYHHVAVGRNGGNTYMYQDGVQQGATYVDATNYLATNQAILFNNIATNIGASGLPMQEFRITLALNRYPNGTAFSRPITQFPDY